MVYIYSNPVPAQDVRLEQPGTNRMRASELKIERTPAEAPARGSEMQ
jgi:hypothetical protein